MWAGGSVAEGPLGLARGHVHKEGVLTGVGRLDQGLEGRMRPLRVEGRKGE